VITSLRLVVEISVRYLSHDLVLMICSVLYDLLPIKSPLCLSPKSDILPGLVFGGEVKKVPEESTSSQVSPRDPKHTPGRGG
jgi:hypothetical protein